MKKEKKKILNSLKETCCRIRVSKIHGVGVAAIREIKKGEEIFFGVRKQSWHEFSPKELKAVSPPVLKMISDFFGADKRGNFIIPGCALNGMDISFFLNTSKNPNVHTPDCGLSFFAQRNIRQGEELTVSYKSYDSRY